LNFPLRYGRVLHTSLRGQRGNFTVCDCHIEPVNDQLKNISQIEHSRHRSLTNGVVNVLAALSAYTYQEKKPSLHFTAPELATLPTAIF
jgi:hypothetical protein